MEEAKVQALIHARDTVDEWGSHTTDKTLLVRLLNLAFNETGTRALLECSEDWPSRSPETGSEDTDRSTAAAAREVLGKIMEDREDGCWLWHARALGSPSPPDPSSRFVA